MSKKKDSNSKIDVLGLELTEKPVAGVELEEAVKVLEDQTVTIETAATMLELSSMYLRKLMTEKVVTPMILNVFGRSRIPNDQIPVIAEQRAQATAARKAVREEAKRLKKEAKGTSDSGTSAPAKVTLQALRLLARKYAQKTSGRNKNELITALASVGVTIADDGTVYEPVTIEQLPLEFDSTPQQPDLPDVLLDDSVGVDLGI